MSNESFAHLLTLTGAFGQSVPRVYDGSWPGFLRRALQIATNAIELLRSCGTFVAVHGRGVPVAVGHVRVDGVISMRALVRGSRVLRGGQLAKLTNCLAIEACSQIDAFLATEDVLVVFGARSGTALAIHISANEVHLGRQRQGIATARKVFAECLADAYIPRIIEWRQVEGGWALFQERLDGLVIDPANLSAQELEAFIEAAFRPLLRLESLAEPCKDGPDHQVIFDGLQSLERHPVLGAYIERPLTALRNWPGRQQCRSVFAHGDYWFQNLLFSGDGTPLLTGIIDWERCRTSALPGADALYLVTFGFSRWRRCPEFTVLCDLWDGNCEPVLERLIKRICTVFCLSLDDLRFVAILMWLMHLRLRGPWLMEWSAGRFHEWVVLPAVSIGQWLRRMELSAVDKL